MIRYTITFEEKFLAISACSSDAHTTASTEGKKCLFKNFVLLKIRYLLDRLRNLATPLNFDLIDFESEEYESILS